LNRWEANIANLGKLMSMVTHELWMWGKHSWTVLFVCVCGIGAWTQGLHLKPLYQPFFVMVVFDRVSWTICWLQTAIFLISVSWVARITGMSHWCMTGQFYVLKSTQATVFCFTLKW
jgi:hypothetical protein